MSKKILMLSEETINQIAAGEVIENPASVIKELIENSIDAGATQICIEVLSGGFQSIKIIDNGSGMSSEDAVLSLQRHATSKIIGAEDLFSLKTMGFRGEALASIASISKMTLLTALENASAVFLEVEGGKIQQISPAARTQGTTIEVRSLFYNVPARKKFQKTATASSAEITKTVTQSALAHPEIGFELIQQTRSQFSLPASCGEIFSSLLKRRVAILLGDLFLNSTSTFEMNEGNYQAKGLIGDPLCARHNRSGQSLFVNRRPVFCPLISFAIRDAYGTRLSTDRHPIYLLHLSIPPKLLDVNVHPQKKEIRLHEEDRVKSFLRSSIRNALSFPLQENEGLFEDSKKTSLLFHNRGFENDLAQGQKDQNTGDVHSISRVNGYPLKEGPFSSFESSAFPKEWKKIPRPDFSIPLVLKEGVPEAPLQELPLEMQIQPIGLYRHYFLLEATCMPPPFTGEGCGIACFDLLSVESKIHFETLMLPSEALPCLSQGLLIPLTLSYSRAEAQLLKARLEAIKNLGIHIREMGETVFFIEAIPAFLQEEEVSLVLEEMIAEMHGIEQERSWKEEEHRRLAICICKQVRLRKKNYSISEAIRLIQELRQVNDPLHCPQGRKTLFHLKEETLESYFTRKTTPSHTAEIFTSRLET